MYIGLILKSYTDISKGSKNFSPKDKALTQRIVDIFHSLSHIKHYLPIQTASTSTITSITIRPRWTAPGNTGTSGDRRRPCGGCLTGYVWSMTCSLSQTQSSAARAAFFITANGSGSVPRPTSSGYGWPSLPPSNKSPPTSPRSSGSWRRPGIR